ncbi:MAG: hypothetical protein ACJAVK_002224 [Akkermansiaceae bacterium]
MNVQRSQTHIMKESSSKALFALSWLGALGIGLMLGRHALPASTGLIGNNGRSNGESIRPPNSLDSPSDAEEARNSRRRESKSTRGASDNEAHELNMVELSDILNVGNRLDRTRQMLDYIDRLDESQITGIIESFREAGWVDYNRGEYSMLISAWMDRDPFKAIAYLDKNDADGWTRKIAISSWASDNPIDAAAAIKGLEDEGKVNDWMVGLIEGIARNDPEGALQALADLPGGHTKNEAIRKILPEVVARGAEFAGDWIEQIDEPKLQRETAKRLAHSLARKDPESASDWIRNMTKVDTRRDASEIVSEIYAQQDLAGAKEWASSLPQDTMTEAAEGVAKYLAREDPVEAARWLQGLGDDPDLDGARFRFLQEASRQDPQTALENVSTLSRSNDQERYYHDILNRWRKQDQGAAVAWALAHSESLPPKVLKGILPKPKKAK